VTVPKEISSLIERFDLNLEAYRSGQYNETQLRREFVDPFFKALGWDVDNEKGYAEAYKDVIHEDAIKVGGAVKAPDYCFRIGGARKFFLEAKKPSVNLKEDINPAFQLRRYAWSAKLPLSILTDFEEFAVYDCRIKPVLTDKASTARILYLSYPEYARRWNEIASIFSREAVLKGSFDKYVESTKIKKGTAEVDSAFLKEIELWREMLARTLALRNPGLTQRELNFAVQRIIDRVIFLRICEDRGIEEYGRLMALLNGAQVYERLSQLFYEADDRYNSGLFHFRREKDRKEPPDELTQRLKIDDRVLKEIIKNLYYPDSPYEFSVLPADILGQVYEQFLGKVIRLTEGHRAVVEDKPEVKKAGGVYYTPTYIVDYIVKNTVGKLVEGKTPRQVAKLKILDPACGSGSFLIGAYQLLLDYHRDWYVKDGPEKWRKARSPVLYQAAGGDWRLTTAERRRILLNNIFGVDIDPQAVEVTKLSLLLKVLEGENEQTILRQLKMFQERALPDLGNNIKCGNSLIGPDFYDGKQMNLFDDEERYRVNVFDWDKEFPEIMKGGGFDAVIGNPPYIRIQGFGANQIEYFKCKFESAKGNVDIYVSFIEAGYRLLSNIGILGMIVPNKFFKTDYGEALRDLLTKKKAIHEVVDFGAEQVFEATTYTCLFFLIKKQSDTFYYTKAQASPYSLSNLEFVEKKVESIGKEVWLFGDEAVITIHEKLLRNTKRLLDLPAEMNRGSSSGNDEVFMLSDKEVIIEKNILRKPIFATDFKRYSFIPSNQWEIIFPYRVTSDSYEPFSEEELRSKFPKAYKYLEAHSAELKKRKQFKNWFGFSAPRSLNLHDGAHIIVPLLANKGMFALIPDNSRGSLCPMASAGFTITLLPTCNLDARYVLGLINSQLLFWKLQSISNIFRGGWITCTKQYLGELPIRTIDFSDPADKARHDKIVELVEQMLSLNKQLATAKTDHDKTLLQRQIDAIDMQIDRLVYELYGLTEEEIKIVEQGS
jgi:type I restriction-modification system DNA methylase subunit